AALPPPVSSPKNQLQRRQVAPSTSCQSFNSAKRKCNGDAAVRYPRDAPHTPHPARLRARRMGRDLAAVRTSVGICRALNAGMQPSRTFIHIALALVATSLIAPARQLAAQGGPKTTRP